MNIDIASPIGSYVAQHFITEEGVILLQRIVACCYIHLGRDENHPTGQVKGVCFQFLSQCQGLHKL